MSMVTDLASSNPGIASISLIRSAVEACDAADDAEADADADADEADADAADDEPWPEQPASSTPDSAITQTAAKYFLIPFMSFLPFPRVLFSCVMTGYGACFVNSSITVAKPRECAWAACCGCGGMHRVRCDVEAEGVLCGSACCVIHLKLSQAIGKKCLPMDFQAYVDCCSVPCAVLSVEKTDEDQCGQIRIVCANEQYKEAMGPTYYDNMPYEELVTKDVKFEDFCFRAAHMNQRMHAYVETKALNCWTDQVMVPLEPQDGKMGYCQFVFEFTKEPDPERMAGVSMDTAAAAIRANIMLLGGEDFQESVGEVLDDIREMSGAFSCRIMLIDHEKRIASTFSEVFVGGYVPNAHLGGGSISYDVVASWEDMIGESNAIIVKDERDMASLERRNPTWVISLRTYNVTSLVLVPLRRVKEVIGYLYVVNFDVDKVVEVKELVELMSFFLGSEIANYLMMNKLEQLSTVDQLTGMLNRNAMLQRMSDIDKANPRGSFGIVNIDINGLKTTNDQHGHEAGDDLLVAAASVLKRAFRKDDLFRVGGDEFVVIAQGMSRKPFEARVAWLRAAAEANPNVSFAIGACWSEGSMSTHEAYSVADKHMYDDKRAFYTAFPEQKRDEAGLAPRV